MLFITMGKKAWKKAAEIVAASGECMCCSYYS